MAELLLGTTLIDVILSIIVFEAVVLFWLRRRWSTGPGLARIVFHLASGACLLMALRVSLAGDDGNLILAWLAAAFAVHLIDLRQRWSG